MVAFDYGKLRGKIKECCNTQANFANKIGISTTSVSAKLNGQVQFTQEEIKKAAEVLNISPSEISLYFFNLKVQ